VPQHPNPVYRIDASDTHEVVTGLDIRLTLRSLKELGNAMRSRMAHGNAYVVGSCAEVVSATSCCGS